MLRQWNYCTWHWHYLWRGHYSTTTPVTCGFSHHTTADGWLQVCREIIGEIKRKSTISFSLTVKEGISDVWGEGGTQLSMDEIWKQPSHLNQPSLTKLPRHPMHVIFYSFLNILAPHSILCRRTRRQPLHLMQPSLTRLPRYPTPIIFDSSLSLLPLYSSLCHLAHRTSQWE